MISVEAALTTLIGILLGGLIALLTLVPFAMALDGSLLPPGTPRLYLLVTGSAAALTLLATLTAGVVTLRVRSATSEAAS